MMRKTAEKFLRLAARDKEYIVAQMAGLEGTDAAQAAARLAKKFGISKKRVYELSESVRPHRRTRSDKRLLDTDIRRLLEKTDKAVGEYDHLIELLKARMKNKRLTSGAFARLSTELRGAEKDRLDAMHRADYQRRLEEAQKKEQAATEGTEDTEGPSALEMLCKSAACAAILSSQRILAEVLGLKWFSHWSKIERHEKANPKRNQVLAPRGGAKSMKRSVLNPIDIILHDFNAAILLTADIEQQACDNLFLVALHLQNNEMLNWCFGSFYDGKNIWNENGITIAQRTEPQKEKSVEAWGMHSRGYHGKHYTHILPDDWVSEENSRTEAGRAKVKRTYEKRLYFCRRPTTIFEWTGTRFHPQDLYGEFMDNAYKDSTLVIPGIRVDKLGRERSFCPELWPLDTTIDPEIGQERTGLREVRSEIGSIAFETQIQQNAKVMQGNKILEEWIQYYDDEPENVKIYQGVDPAVGTKKQNCYSCLITIGVIRGRLPKIYVMDVVRRKVTPLIFLQTCIVKFNQFDPIKQFWETNAYQAAGEEFAHKLGGIRTAGINTDKDKITRVEKNSAIFEDGRVFIKRGQPWTNGFVQRLVALQEGAEWWDEADALDIAIRGGAKRTGAMVH